MEEVDTLETDAELQSEIQLWRMTNILKEKKGLPGLSAMILLGRRVAHRLKKIDKVDINFVCKTFYIEVYEV